MIRSAFKSRRAKIVAALLVLTAALLITERSGVRTHPGFRLGGDLRREARIFEQYGQVASGLVIAILIWQLDPPRRRMLVPMALTLLITAGVVTVMKQTIGRGRPSAVNDAAQLNAPPGDNDSKRESFPSGHSAAAVATTVVLAALYPRGRAVFWGLAIACAVLRYVNNAHWPSDVFAGITVGYITSSIAWYVLVERHRAKTFDSATAALIPHS
jgi:membrane-associated phospholipid phosphatase